MKSGEYGPARSGAARQRAADPAQELKVTA